MKIALIGAGSRSFGPAMIRDLLLSDALNHEELELALMDIVAAHLAEPEAYARAAAQRLGRRLKLVTTTNLDQAVTGAAFVITAIEIDRYLYWAQDFHVPRQYGFLQIYGENGGPGGLFHALRNMGPMVEIARAMERHCPQAWLLNFTNPESKLCEAVTRLTGIRTVGLCHGVFMGRAQIARFLDLNPDQLVTVACGLNHFTWFLSVRHRETGEDLYPRLRERELAADPLADWDELALGRACLRVFGLWPSPGANHIGEYIRWADEFLASSKLQYFYDPLEGHPWETGKVPRFVYSFGGKPTHVPLFPEVPPPAPPAEHAAPLPVVPLKPSGELAVPLIEALGCGVAHELAAINVPNQGTIPDVADETVVEIPATADARGVQAPQLPPLPEAIVAMIRTQASIQHLLVEAYAEKSRRKLLQALLLDPTAHSYRNSVALINEMCELQQALLPPLTW